LRVRSLIEASAPVQRAVGQHLLGGRVECGDELVGQRAALAAALMRQRGSDSLCGLHSRSSAIALELRARMTRSARAPSRLHHSAYLCSAGSAKDDAVARRQGTVMLHPPQRHFCKRDVVLLRDRQEAFDGLDVEVLDVALAVHSRQLAA